MTASTTSGFTISANSEYPGGYYGWYACDNTFATEWAIDGTSLDTGILTVQMPTQYIVTKMALSFRFISGTIEGWYNIALAGSNDGSTYTTIYSTVFGSAMTGIIELPVNNTTAYSYYRFTGTNKYINNPGLAYFQLYQSNSSSSIYLSGTGPTGPTGPVGIPGSTGATGPISAPINIPITNMAYLTPDTWSGSSLTYTGSGVGGSYTISTTSEYIDGNYSLKQAFNQNYSTDWATNGVSTANVIIQTPGNVNACYLFMKSRIDGAADSFKHFYVQTSTNGTTYSNITSLLTFSASGNTNPSTFFDYMSANVIIPSGNRNDTYFKIVFIDGYGGANPGLNEVNLLTTTSNIGFPYTTVPPTTPEITLYAGDNGGLYISNMLLNSSAGFTFNLPYSGNLSITVSTYANIISTGYIPLNMYIDGTYTSNSTANATTIININGVAPLISYYGYLTSGLHFLTFAQDGNKADPNTNHIYFTSSSAITMSARLYP